MTTVATTWRGWRRGIGHMLPRTLAGIKRTGAKKSVALESCHREDDGMFSVHCAGHRSRVILSNRAITALVNTDHGIELHWRCHCGTTGVELVGALAQPRVA
jgi:hypothetical protein